MATVVITGGSRGIGAAAVELFAARGDRVYFLYEKDHTAAENVAKKTGATPICCDVADVQAVKAAFDKIPEVDILVCNAGIAHYGLMSMVDEETWDRVFAVNVKGIYHCVNAATPFFLRKQAGSVAYSASKGAVIALTKTLAQELGPSGIRVNCVAPGVILTDMCANVDKDVLAEMAQESCVGRNGTPMDVAKAIAYLADSEFVTGQVLAVNGGYVIS